MSGVEQQSARLRPEVLDHVFNPADALEALDREQRLKLRVVPRPRGTSLRLDEIPESREGISALGVDLRMEPQYRRTRRFSADARNPPLGRPYRPRRDRRDDHHY